MEATFLLLLFPALLATHHQHVVVESDLDVLLLDTGHFRWQSCTACRFPRMSEGRLQHARPIGWPLRHVQRRKTEAPECVIEQPVDFPMQLQDRADWPARRWQVIALHRQGRDGLLLLLLVLEPVPGANFLKSMSMSYLQKNWKTSYSSPLPAVTGSAPRRHGLLG